MGQLRGNVIGCRSHSNIKRSEIKTKMYLASYQNPHGFFPGLQHKAPIYFSAFTTVLLYSDFYTAAIKILFYMPGPTRLLAS